MLHPVTHGEPNRVPKEDGFTPARMERFQREAGSDSPADYCGMESRSVGFAPLREENSPDFSEYLSDVPPSARLMGEYGTASIPANFYHFWGYVFPLRKAQMVDKIERYPWLYVTLNYRRHAHEAQVAKLHEDDNFVTGFARHNL